MKQSDVEVGKVYLAKVSGVVVRVLVKREYPPVFSGKRRSYECVNLKTSREVSMSAAKLRKLSRNQDTRTDKEIAAAKKAEVCHCGREPIGRKHGEWGPRLCYYHLHPHQTPSQRSIAGLWFALRFLDWQASFQKTAGKPVSFQHGDIVAASHGRVLGEVIDKWRGWVFYRNGFGGKGSVRAECCVLVTRSADRNPPGKAEEEGRDCEVCGERYSGSALRAYMRNGVCVRCRKGGN